VVFSGFVMYVFGRSWLNKIQIKVVCFALMQRLEARASFTLSKRLMIPLYVPGYN
jgi:hypothetical protein